MKVPALTFWHVADDIYWFQAKTSRVAEILKRRTGFKRVGYSVQGSFARIFEARLSYPKAKKLVDDLLRRFEPKGFQQEASGLADNQVQVRGVGSEQHNA
jgi:hypothetical protein